MWRLLPLQMVENDGHHIIYAWNYVRGASSCDGRLMSCKRCSSCREISKRARTQADATQTKRIPGLSQVGSEEKRVGEADTGDDKAARDVC